MNHSNSAIQAAYDRIIRLARNYGLDPRWELVRGRDRVANTPREPWVIKQGDLVLFTLGFTRRAALDALTTIATVFDYLVTTDEWREEGSEQ
jgi:hypothetical protein